MGKVFTILILAGAWYSGYGQNEWTLQSEKEGVSVYTRNFPDSKFKAIRVELEVEASLSQMVAVLLDVDSGVNWVYGTKSSVLLKRISPTEVYYYSEVNIPWPFNNRDFIALLRVSQDSVTHVVTVDGPTMADYLPAKKDIVRVARSEGKWVLTPIRRGRIHVQYTLRTDPGGELPAWLFNLFVAKGPSESIRNLKVQLQKPAYSKVQLAFIVD
jgi:hypothetical protein